MNFDEPADEVIRAARAIGRWGEVFERMKGHAVSCLCPACREFMTLGADIGAARESLLLAAATVNFKKEMVQSQKKREGKEGKAQSKCQ